MRTVQVCVGLVLASLASGQEFEAASVKLSAGGPFVTSMVGGPGTPDPGRIAFTQISLRNLLGQAYGVGYDAIEGTAWLGVVGWMSWLRSREGRPRSATMDDFAASLPCRCDVVNETGLAGRYDFVLVADVSRLTQTPSGTDEAKELVRSGVLPAEAVSGEVFPTYFARLKCSWG